MPDDAHNPRIFEGANHPPATDPFEGFTAHIGDLFDEAKNFLDGAGVADQGQADAVSKLLDMLRQASKDADAARSAEKRPHDEAAKAVQAKWKPLLDRAELAMKSCKDALAPWLRNVEEQMRAAAEAARKEAEEKARLAAEAVRAAQTNDLAAREAAEALLADAKAAAGAANAASSDRAHAKGGARATTLRSYFRPVLADAREALRHYAADRPDDLKAALLRFAEQDVQAGKRTIPGFTIEEERRVV